MPKIFEGALLTNHGIVVPLHRNTPAEFPAVPAEDYPQERKDAMWEEGLKRLDAQRGLNPDTGQPPDVARGR